MKTALNTIRDFWGSVTTYLNKQPSFFWIASALLFIFIQGFFDFLTGDFSLMIFDLVPIFSVTWFVGRWSGVFISFACALSWFIVDSIETPVHSHFLVHYWNMVIKFCFFVIVSHVLLELKRALMREKELARIDHLTGAINGRAFLEKSFTELDMFRRYKHVFTIAYLDIDNFKDINDTFGHSIGDTLLQVAVQIMKHNTRTVDTIARLGGDEFAIMLPETGYESAHVVIERLKEVLLEAMQARGWPVTFSIGAITYVNPPASVDEMIKKVDEAMYSVKKSGKDMIRHETFGD